MVFVPVPGATDQTLAQDSSPPTVSIGPGTGTFFGPNVAVTIEWCDDNELDGGSRYIELNGQGVTSSFSFEWLSPTGPCGQRAKSEGTVTLNVGSNQLYAQICDGYQGPLGPQPLGPGGGGACESSNLGSKTVWYRDPVRSFRRRRGLACPSRRASTRARFSSTRQRVATDRSRSGPRSRCS